jgi:hypothetical protein
MNQIDVRSRLPRLVQQAKLIKEERNWNWRNKEKRRKNPCERSSVRMVWAAINYRPGKAVFIVTFVVDPMFLKEQI